MFREGLRFFFKRLDADVVVLEASNIQGPLDKLVLESPVDLLVLDLQMPGMSELEGFFAIQALEAGAAKVICIEPNADMAECLRRTFASEIVAEKIAVRNSAVGAMDGTATYARSY